MTLPSRLDILGAVRHIFSGAPVGMASEPAAQVPPSGPSQAELRRRLLLALAQGGRPLQPGPSEDEQAGQPPQIVRGVEEQPPPPPEAPPPQAPSFLDRLGAGAADFGQGAQAAREIQAQLPRQAIGAATQPLFFARDPFRNEEPNIITRALQGIAEQPPGAGFLPITTAAPAAEAIMGAGARVAGRAALVAAGRGAEVIPAPLRRLAVEEAGRPSSGFSFGQMGNEPVAITEKVVALAKRMGKPAEPGELEALQQMQKAMDNELSTSLALGVRSNYTTSGTLETLIQNRINELKGVADRLDYDFQNIMQQALHPEQGDLFGPPKPTYRPENAPIETQGGMPIEAPTKPREPQPGEQPLPGFEAVAPPMPPTGNVSGLTTNVDDFLRNLDTSDEVKDFLRQTITESVPDIQAQRRGVLSDEAVNQLADGLGFTDTKLMKMKPGIALNPEQTRAAARTFLGMAEDVQQAAAKAAASGGFEDRLLAVERILKLQAAQEGIFGARAEAGRTLRQWRAIKGALAEPGNYQKMLNQVPKELQNDSFLRALAAIPENDTLGLTRLVRDSTKRNFADRITGYTYANMLSGPLTHERNILGNIISFWEEAGSRGITSPSEFTPLVAGWFRGAPEGARRALYVLREGITPEQVAKLDLPHTSEFVGGLANPWNIPGRMLEAADQLFRSMAFQAELYARATRAARAEGLRGDALVGRAAELRLNPTAEMIAQAERFSDLATYREPLTDLGQRIQSLRDWAAPGGIQPLRLIVPFLRTVYNISKRSLQTSPLGLVGAGIEKGLGRPDTQEILGRGILGTGILVAALPAAMMGNITGAAPTNSADREAWFATGRRPYSLKLGKQWVPYLWAGPAAMPFIMAAAAADAFGKTGKPPGTDEISQAVKTLSGFVLGQTFLQGANALFEMLNADPSSAERWFNGILSQFGPLSGFQRQLEHALDGWVRSPDTWAQDAQRQFLPATEFMLPKRLTPLGEEAQRPGGITRITPFPFSPENPDPVVQELLRLNVTPAMPAKDLEFSLPTKAGRGIKIPLTPEERRDYIRQTAGLFMPVIRDVLPTLEYVSDEDKKRLLDSLISRAREAAKGQVLSQMEDLDARLEKAIASAGGAQ